MPEQAAATSLTTARVNQECPAISYRRHPHRQSVAFGNRYRPGYCLVADRRRLCRALDRICLIGDWLGISGDAGLSIEPAIAADSTGRQYVAWADSRNGNFEIYVTRHASGAWQELAGSGHDGGVSVTLDSNRDGQASRWMQPVRRSSLGRRLPAAAAIFMPPGSMPRPTAD